MKKQILITSTMFAALLLVLTGCSSSAPASNGGQANNQNPAGQPGPRRPDFGQPQRQPDIRGVVKSIVGNEATILKVDTNFRQASSTPDNGSGGASTTRSATRLSLGGTGGGAGGGRGGAGGGFGGPGGPGGPGGGGASNRAAMIAQLEAMSTGEDTVIIPVGIKMLKPDASSTTGKRTMVEATLADITPDKIITIWLNTAVTDKKVADFVLIN